MFFEGRCKWPGWELSARSTTVLWTRSRASSGLRESRVYIEAYGLTFVSDRSPIASWTENTILMGVARSESGPQYRHVLLHLRTREGAARSLMTMQRGSVMAGRVGALSDEAHYCR